MLGTPRTTGRTDKKSYSNVLLAAEDTDTDTQPRYLSSRTGRQVVNRGTCQQGQGDWCRTKVLVIKDRETGAEPRYLSSRTGIQVLNQGTGTGQGQGDRC